MQNIIYYKLYVGVCIFITHAATATPIYFLINELLCQGNVKLTLLFQNLFPPLISTSPRHPASVFSPWLDNVQSIIHCYVIYVLVHESNRNCILHHTFYIFLFCVTVYIFGKALFIESERSLHITLFNLNLVFIVLFYLIPPTLTWSRHYNKIFKFKEKEREKKLQVFKIIFKIYKQIPLVLNFFFETYCYNLSIYLLFLYLCISLETWLFPIKVNPLILELLWLDIYPNKQTHMTLL